MKERRVIYDPHLINDRTPRGLGHALQRLWHALLYIVSVVSVVGAGYYLIPGFPHVFASGNANDVQPTHVALLIIVLLVAMYFSPKKEH